jgi:nucleoside-diphosphate-sugar epimerase
MRAPYIPQRILVTGATGTLGRLILPALARLGAPVRALAHKGGPSISSLRIAEQREGDLERPLSLHGIADGCDVVVHAASPPGFTSLDRRRQRRIHVEGTEAVLRESQSAGAKLFILLGYTGTIQERADVTAPVDEETPPEAEYVSDSVRMIYEAEALVLEANRQQALRTVVVSQGVLASPGIPTALGGLMAAFLRRELPFRILDQVWLAPSDGGDMGRCVTAAIEHAHGGRRYFAVGECLRLGDLYARMTRLTGIAAPRRRLPDLLAEELGHLTPVLPPHSFLRQLVLPRELVLHLQRLAPLENARTRAELGLVPTPLDELILRFGRAEGVLAGDLAGAAG